MNYLVQESPAVLARLSKFSEAVRGDYATVRAILADTPRGHPAFSAIQEGMSPQGRRYYQYLDGILPVILQYRVFESDTAWQRGFVWVARALALDEDWRPLEWGE